MASLSTLFSSAKKLAEWLRQKMVLLHDMKKTASGKGADVADKVLVRLHSRLEELQVRSKTQVLYWIDKMIEGFTGNMVIPDVLPPLKDEDGLPLRIKSQLDTNLAHRPEEFNNKAFDGLEATTSSVGILSADRRGHYYELLFQPYPYLLKRVYAYHHWYPAQFAMIYPRPKEIFVEWTRNYGGSIIVTPDGQTIFVTQYSMEPFVGPLAVPVDTDEKPFRYRFWPPAHPDQILNEEYQKYWPINFVQ